MVSAVAQHIAYLTASQLHDYSLRFFSFFGKPRVIIRVPAALGFADAGLAALFSAFRGELAVQFRVHFLQEIQIAFFAKNERGDRKSTRLNSSHTMTSRMPSSA